MSREEVYREIEEAFGLVPTFFKLVPDSSLELEWQLFKRTQLEQGAVPQKYRELIGIARDGSVGIGIKICVFLNWDLQISPRVWPF